mmetsp:Transcript_10042/g.24783  ORF Transcript_10042/g.24783 Transcript_10042/m.24783 type:complete len:244 (+) Transcript_10042:198-929(+)
MISADNPVVGIMIGASDLPFVWDVTLFLCLSQILDNVTGGEKTSVWGTAKNVLTVFLNAFGGIHILLPVILGTFPAPLLEELDRYLAVYVSVVVFGVLLAGYLPEKLLSLLAPLKKLAYAIYFSNVCIYAVVQGLSAFQYSKAAPLLLGFLAVNGGQLLQKGATTEFFGKEYTTDQLLSLGGPAIYVCATSADIAGQYAVSSDIARCLVLLFTLSCEIVDYNEMLAYVNDLRIKALKKIAVYK